MKIVKQDAIITQPEMEKYAFREKTSISQALLLQLLKNYPEGSISIIDKEFNFIYTGGGLYKQIHCNPDRLAGKKIFSVFPGSLHSKIKAELFQVFSGNTVSDFELTDCFIKGHSYSMEAFPLFEEDDAIDKAGVIINNITDLKQTEATLIKSLDKEKELGELKSRFVSAASHEFRTPLSTILSSAYLLSKYTTTEEQYKREKHLERIISSVNTLTDILNDFLSLGRIEEGKISVVPVEINVDEMINGILSEMNPTLKRGQRIQYDHMGAKRIILDKGLLKRVVLNLLSNAIKFSNENSLIEVKTQVNQDFVLSVKDHGMGISAEDQSHLFERFFRGSNAMNIQGTGLGLHIVARYVELMNGTIIYHSKPDEGTEFCIRFKQLTDDCYAMTHML